MELKKQLEISQFHEFKNYIETLLKEKIKLELKKIEKEDPDALPMIQDIFDNLLYKIDLTMFEDGIEKITLITFHYYLKVLESYAQMYLDERGVTNIKRAKNPLELFLKDLYYIISKNPELTRFLLTLKSLIEQWLIKYNSKTKISEFYYDILMITPDQIIERILKYLIFTAIKNKNPMTLRAIFSSYLTLIHQNIFSFYATNLSKVKVGFFKQLENLFTENFNLIFENNVSISNGIYLTELMLITFLNKHKRFLKDDYYSFNDEFLLSFFEPNYHDVLRSYDKENINFIDHNFIYNSILKFTNNSKIFKLPYYHKLNYVFFKNNSRKKNFNLIKEYLNQYLFDYFYEIIPDRESVEEIFNVMAKDLSIKLNYNLFLDEEFKVSNTEFDEVKTYIEQFIILLANKIN
jgi:hypothetical protein